MMNSESINMIDHLIMNVFDFDKYESSKINCSMRKTD